MLWTMPSFYWGYCLVGPNQSRQKNLVYVMLIFTASICVLAGWQLFKTGSLSVFLGNNYLVAGQSIGVALILMQVLIFQLKKSPHVSGAVGILIGLLMYNPGRGPLLTGLITLGICYILYSKSIGFKNLLHHGVIVVFGMSVFHFSYYLGSGASPEGLVRITHALNHPNQDGSLVERLEYAQKAWSVFKKFPCFGAGFGAWPESAGYGTLFLHPHNIALEIASELGLLGLILFAVTVVFAFYYGLYQPFIYHRSFVLVGLYTFLNALKSGDLNDNILLFFSLGCLSYPLFTKKGRKTPYLE